MKLAALQALVAAGESLTLKLKKSKPWNPWIAKVFYRRGLIETWGRGTLKIAGLMQEAGLDAPALKDNAGFVTMTFKLPAGANKTHGKTPYAGSEKSSEKSSEKIIQHLRLDPTLSAKALAQKLAISSRAVEKQIAQLRKEGKLCHIGPAKGGRWELIE